MPAKTSLPSDEPGAAELPPVADGPVATAPEVPHAIAKKYGVHTEALHAPVAAAEPEQRPDLKGGLETVTDMEVSLTDTVINAPETDAAVDDILNKESDQLLDMQNDPASVVPHPVQKGGRLKHFLRRWWRNKWARYTTLLVLLAAIAAVAILPQTRYAVLNTFGVRSSASVVILDDTTQLPLKNVSVRIDSETVQTNKEGVATIRNITLGKHHLEVKRLAFAPYSQDVTIGWGSNPLGHISLRAVGTQYEIMVTDFLSGKPIKGAEVESEEINALSDDKGKITLTVADTSVTRLNVIINAPGYRSEPVVLTGDTTKVTPLTMVPAQKTVYVSKESGKYDVYASDIDGRDKKVLLAGTGLETTTISLAVSPDGTQAALVSTRDNLRDDDNYLLYALTFINIQTGASVTVDRAQQLQMVDWLGSKLVYRSTLAGASAANPARSRLVAYNYQANARTQLATANQFNTVISADGYIYYSASSNDPSALLGLYRVKADASGRERLFDQEVWTGLRTQANVLSLQTPTGWFTFDVPAKKAQPANAPAVFTSFYFASDPKDSRVAWADARDGKGTLLLKNNADSKVTALVTQPGLVAPVRWLNDKVIVYRVVTATESADYAVSTDGGAPRKLSNVTATYSYIQAY